MSGSAERLLAHRGFARLWYARLASVAASQMLMVALGWQMYELTGSAWDLGLVGLLQFAPALALALPAGHWIDRHHRGRIVAACLLVQLLVALVLTQGSLRGLVARDWLLAASVVLGAVRAFQMPAQQALTPLLVPPHLLPRAVAFSSAGLQAAIIAGPALGGLVYAAGAGLTYGLCALLFAIGSGLCFGIRYAHQAPPPEPATLATLLAGVNFVRHHPVVLGAISLDLFAVLLGGATALLPIYAKDILFVGPWGLGLLRSAPAAGALAVSLLLARHPLRRRVGPLLLGAVAVYGLATLAFGLSSHFGLSLAALAVTGAADMVSVVIRQTLVQLETPNEMRGRVSAVNSLFIGASNQLGEFESGATAALLGPVGSVVLGGAGTLLVAALWLRLFPALATRDDLLQAGTAEPAARARA
ncbi:MFS transporter [Rubrivivax sp. A210]|uniref:MFS transporter n=1 Tax=Rubrivivax sp. A210 TaxID=2772301 RepID=UPI00191B292F|nr:MFS transporter [Rubrivivax sp. A210]CAD5372986.1 MFS transporter [Rubrivivax sp. A210]